MNAVVEHNVQILESQEIGVPTLRNETMQLIEPLHTEQGVQVYSGKYTCWILLSTLSVKFARCSTRSKLETGLAPARELPLDEANYAEALIFVTCRWLNGTPYYQIAFDNRAENELLRSTIGEDRYAIVQQSFAAYNEKHKQPSLEQISALTQIQQRPSKPWWRFGL